MGPNCKYHVEDWLNANLLTAWFNRARFIIIAIGGWKAHWLFVRLRWDVSDEIQYSTNSGTPVKELAFHGVVCGASL